MGLIINLLTSSLFFIMNDLISRVTQSLHDYTRSPFINSNGTWNHRKIAPVLLCSIGCALAIFAITSQQTLSLLRNYRFCKIGIAVAGFIAIIAKLSLGNGTLDPKQIPLRHLSPAERIKVQQAHSHPQLQELVDFIMKGNWKNFLLLADKLDQATTNSDTYREESKLADKVDESADRDRTASYIMIAAYEKEKIPLTTLATCLMLHFLYTEDRSAIRITRKPTKEIIDLLIKRTSLELAFSMKDGESVESLKEKIHSRFNSVSIPLNEQMIIEVKCSSLNEYTQKLMNSSIFKIDRCPTIYHQAQYIGALADSHNQEAYYGIASFSILKEFYALQNIDLAPEVHFNPGRKDVMSMVSKNQTPFALLLAGAKIPIHGAIKSNIFSFLHDLLHAKVRAENIKYKGLLEDSVTIFHHIQQYLDNHPMEYTHKLIFEEELAPTFKIQPTTEEFYHYVLRRVSGALIDGDFAPCLLSKDNYCVDIWSLFNNKIDFVLKGMLRQELNIPADLYIKQYKVKRIFTNPKYGDLSEPARQTWEFIKRAGKYSQLRIN